MKRSVKQTVMMCLAALLIGAAAGSSEPEQSGFPPILPMHAAARGVAEFAEAPTEDRSGDTVIITFGVKAPMDVEVSVIDADGRIVKHLAVGMLGDNSPPPFSPGLKQKLTWDGTDDAGRPAAGAPHRHGPTLSYEDQEELS